MAIFHFFRLRNLLVLALIGIFAATGYGFATANEVQVSGAGDGEAAISGYKTAGITYTLDGSNPVNITKVSFTLSSLDAAVGNAKYVKAKLVDSSNTWSDCATSDAGTTWSCAMTAVTVASVDKLTVVAAQ